MAVQNGTAETLTSRQQQAAILVAADELPDMEIAARCQIGRTTLNRWRELPAFQRAVSAQVMRLEAETLRYAIAKRRKRVAALQDRWDRMQRVIDERAADTASGSVRVCVDVETGAHQLIQAPGWETGLLVRTEKQIGAGERALHVVEFAVDTGLLRELRAHEEQAAKELGQWDADAPAGVVLKAYIAVDVDRV